MIPYGFQYSREAKRLLRARANRAKRNVLRAVEQNPRLAKTIEHIDRLLRIRVTGAK